MITATPFSSVLHELFAGTHKGKSKANSSELLKKRVYDGPKTLQQSLDTFRQLLENYKKEQVQPTSPSTSYIL